MKRQKEMIFDYDRLEINKGSDREVAQFLIGSNEYPAITIDNFYKDPDYVRELALSLTFTDTRGTPGHDAYISIGLEPICQVVENLLLAQYGGSVAHKVESEMNTHNFRRLCKTENELNLKQCKPHVESAFLVGLVYLNPDTQCRGGTGFYRHKETGLEELIKIDITSKNSKGTPLYAPGIIKKVFHMGIFNTFKDLQKKEKFGNYRELINFYESLTPAERRYLTDGDDVWECYDKIEMEYNRFVCFPGFILHSAYQRPHWFGSTAETQRLTQNFLFSWPINS
jgi:hypothetical protein